MKGSGTCPDLTDTAKKYTDYAVEHITRICKEIGPRACGSEQESKAHDYINREMHTCADEVKTEPFEVHPMAFMGWVNIDCVLVTCAIVLLNIGLSAYAFIPVALAFFCLITEFALYKQTLDPFYKKRISHNTISTRKASGTTTRHIYIAGHIDSAYEWRPTYYAKKQGLYFVFGYGIVGLLYVTVAAIITCARGFGAAGAAMDQGARVLGYIAYGFIPSYILLFFFLGTNRCVDGANDNLTGVMSAAAVLKYMADNDIRFEHTDVTAIATGGEEAGLRGAKAFAKAHAKQIKDSGVESCFIAVDTVRDYDTFSIYNRDMSGLTRDDPRIAALVKEAGRRSDIDLPYANLFLGASDAAAITQADIPAVCLAAMDPGPPQYYHTRLDTCDNLEPRSIQKGIEILINAVYLFDAQGLKTEYYAGTSNVHEFEPEVMDTQGLAAAAGSEE